MNCKQANELSIVGFLKNQGFEPTKTTGSRYWYLSPLRDEKTPSFTVEPDKNTWSDFGSDGRKRRKLVDLISEMYHVNTSGALLIASGIKPNIKPFSFQKQKEHSCTVEKMQILSTLSVQNPKLLEYLKERGIDLMIARRYCREIRYTVNQKPYFAIAFINDLGGYEIRNNVKTLNYKDGFKGTINPKGITTIPGNSQSVNVFEGFMDFLSFLTHQGIQEPISTTIILNSLSHLNKFIEMLPGYNEIYLFLDNDKPGKNAAKRIQELSPKAMDISGTLFPEYKDFNDYINNKPMTK